MSSILSNLSNAGASVSSAMASVAYDDELELAIVLGNISQQVDNDEMFLYNIKHC